MAIRVRYDKLVVGPIYTELQRIVGSFVFSFFWFGFSSGFFGFEEEKMVAAIERGSTSVVIFENVSV